MDDNAIMVSESRSVCVKDSPVAKRRRKAITLETKLEVLRRYDQGERTADIERHFGLNESTLRTIRDNADTIRKSCMSVTRLGTCRVTVSRSSIMERMESLLVTWLEQQSQQNICVSTTGAKEMAKRLYEDLKRSEPDSDVKAFTASSGWFERFKVRHDYQKVKTTDESATIEKFLHTFKEIVEENHYSPNQVFNITETGLYWKRLPRKCFLTRNWTPKTGFQADNDRCSLLLGGNASGDCKLKPLLVYHEESPKVLKGYSRAHLPVVWHSSKKGLVTSTVFVEYFGCQLHQELKAYCDKENLPFKVLLILDVASGYPPNLPDLSSNIKVLFLPPGAASLLQPLDQGLATIFQCYYHRQVFARLISNSDLECELRAVEFWRGFNLKTAIDIIGEAWAEVSESAVNGMWRKMWPEVVVDSIELSGKKLIRSVKQTVVDMAKSLGLEDVNMHDIENLVQSHKEEMSIEDFQLIEEDRSKEAEESGSDTESVRTLSTDVLSEIFQLGDTILSLIDENDPDRERSSRVAKDFQSVLATYRELYREKTRHASHTYVDRFLVKHE